MAKGCLSKLTGNLTVSCDLNALGVSDLYLMYSSDVTFATDGATFQCSSATFASGAKAYRVEGFKQNIQITASLRTSDISNRTDVSITFKFPARLASLWHAIQNGEFFVLEIPNSPAYYFSIWGINSPLVCTSFEYDSNSNGKMATVTLSAPEGSAGNHRYFCDAKVRDSIIAKSV